MKLKDVQRKESNKKDIRINLKTTKEISKWMKENKVSPQKVFDESMKELMTKK